MSREESGNNWDLLPARMPRCKVPSGGGISDVPFSRWDKNGVYSPAEQITELRQSTGGVYQPRGVP